MNNLNFNNIFDYCVDTTTEENVYYKITNTKSIHISILCINQNKQILKYTNEWLSLIKTYYPSNKIIYNNLVTEYNNIIKQDLFNCKFINEQVVLFITSFSKGTVHGYSGLWYMLYIYMQKYINYKILIYENSQQGILDIIYHIFKKLYGDNYLDYIIILSGDILYKIKNIIIIPNKYHIIKYELAILIDYILYDYIIINTHICSHNKIFITNNTKLDNNIVVNFCIKNNYILIEPNKFNEIDFIKIINSCEIFIVTWGTSFLKNYIYIGDDCKYIDIYIIENTEYECQYNNSYKTNTLIKNYKKAYFNYIKIDNMLKIL